MSQKKLPTRSKIVIVVVAFIATMYLLVVGISYLKSWNDFKPYHKLAVELNQELGGGYLLVEKKSSNCAALESSCPSFDLNKSNPVQSVDTARNVKNKISSFLIQHNFSVDEDQNCLTESNDITYCGLRAHNSDTKQSAIVGVGSKKVSISVFKQ